MTSLIVGLNANERLKELSESKSVSGYLITEEANDRIVRGFFPDEMPEGVLYSALLEFRRFEGYDFLDFITDSEKLLDDVVLVTPAGLSINSSKGLELQVRELHDEIPEMTRVMSLFTLYAKKTAKFFTSDFS